MNFFPKTGLFTKMKTLNVAGKLSLLLVVMLIGFVAIGTTYIAVLNAEKTTQERTNEATQFAKQIEEADSRMLKAVIHLRDFLLGGQIQNRIQHLEGFEAMISNAREILSDLESKALNDQLKRLIVPVDVTITTFHASVYQMAETQLAIGLGQDSGLHGDVRNAVEELEKTLKTLSAQRIKGTAKRDRSSAPSLRLQLLDARLLTSLLHMRQYEKGYLQLTQKQYLDRMANEQANFLTLLKQSKFSSSQQATLGRQLATYQARFKELVKMDTKLREERATVDAAAGAFDPTLDAMVAQTKEALGAILATQQRKFNQLTAVFVLMLVGTAVAVTLIVFFLSRGITNPLRQLYEAVVQVSEGDMTARARLERDDEIGTLANAFDTLLDERMTQLAETEREREARLIEAERENETLNSSVVELLQGVAQLSQRNLTVRVPVAEDVTGAVSDALNLLTEETANVLSEVTKISSEVASASLKVKIQSDAVVSLAGQEREQVVQTSDQLAEAAEAMDAIATHARACNTVAEKAIQKTETALEAVTGTVEGINATRDIIRETEKRIKRLGERSQEISGVVSLINNIAERTHILALNASMHAASAGEAGRGFAVVADEVQRLAENARQATEQIATLVTNIQTETIDTVTTMNTAITQVVEGSRLAGQAGEQMQETKQTTAELVEVVQQIIDSLQVQANISNELRNRANVIVESTVQTSQELATQDEQTLQLLQFSNRLVETVGVFTLPRLDEEHTDELEDDAQMTESSSDEDVTMQSQTLARV